MDIIGGSILVIAVLAICVIFLVFPGLIGFGIILIILGMIFGVMIGSQIPEVGVLMFVIFVIFGVLLIGLGVKARRKGR